MKCVCGHEHDYDSPQPVSKDSNPFIRVGVVEHTGYDSRILNKTTNHRISLYACPKCGTIKIEV